MKADASGAGLPHAAGADGGGSATPVTAVATRALEAWSARPGPDMEADASGMQGDAPGPHPLDGAIALVPAADGTWQGRTSPAYANFIGPYGGITAAQAIHTVLRHPQRIGEPVAITVNFAAALADGAFTARARPLRTNRSTQHWLVELEQDGQCVASATAMTAVRRDTFGGHEARMPDVPAPETLARERFVRRVAWLERYDRRFVVGNIPERWEGQGGDSSLTRLWVRDEPPRPLDFAALTAMADVFFPRIWLRRATMTPLGTVTMTVYFHCDSAQLQATGTGHLLAQAQGQGLRNGYFDHTGQLWNRAGELLATTHQLVYFKE